MLSVWKSIQKIEINSKLLLTQSKKRKGNTSFQRTINGILKSIHEIINIILGSKSKTMYRSRESPIKINDFLQKLPRYYSKTFLIFCLNSMKTWEF